MEDLLFDIYAALKVFDLSVLADLYSKQMLTGLLFASVLISALCAAFFYLIYDHPKFQKKRHYLLVFLFSILFNWILYVIVIVIEKGEEALRFNGQGALFDQNTTTIILFGLSAGVMTFPIFLIASFFMQPFSTNCSTTPIQFPFTRIFNKK